ncbi:MAG: DUF4411 family protein [Candidatus Eremiobacterota bacterium]
MVALAHAKNYVVVTQERAGSQGRPKIPDVCSHHGIRCLTMAQFFRENGWRF